MKGAILLAGAALIGIFLAAPAMAQGVPQTVDIAKVDVRTVAAGYRASKVIGSSVLNQANETIGKIDDLLVTRDGKEPYAVLSVGGFLGMGTRMEGMNALSNWPRNRLLLALPSRNLELLMPELEQIRCRREQILMDADSSLDHVFFPDSGVVSVVAVYASGNIIEMATTVRVGGAGVQAGFGARSSSARLLVQSPGSAAKMSRAAFMRAMESMPSFRSLMLSLIHISEPTRLGMISY